MNEDNIDISDYESNLVDEYFNIQFDYIITVCDNANENCPIFPNSIAKKIHQNFKDPSKVKNGIYGEHFIETRDEIKKFIIEFIEKELA